MNPKRSREEGKMFWIESRGMKEAGMFEEFLCLVVEVYGCG